MGSGLRQARDRRGSRHGDDAVDPSPEKELDRVGDAPDSLEVTIRLMPSSRSSRSTPAMIDWWNWLASEGSVTPTVRVCPLRRLLASTFIR